MTGDFVGNGPLAAAVGMAGRTRGSPYGAKYGPNGSWGEHVGEDWFAPIGTEVKAAFTGYMKHCNGKRTLNYMLEKFVLEGSGKPKE